MQQAFRGKQLGLIRFRTDTVYRPTTPIYVVPLKIDPNKSSISAVSLQVGKIIYITNDVNVVSPLAALLLKEKK